MRDKTMCNERVSYTWPNRNMLYYYLIQAAEQEEQQAGGCQWRGRRQWRGRNVDNIDFVCAFCGSVCVQVVVFVCI